MDRVASAGTSSGRGARTAWRTLHAISPASQGTHETEDDSGSESEEDEDLKGEYRGAVLVRSNGQKGMATTNRTNNGRIGGSWKRALGDFDKQNGKVGATTGVSDEAKPADDDEIATGLRDDVQTVETAEEARRVLKIYSTTPARRIVPCITRAIRKWRTSPWRIKRRSDTVK